MQSPGPRVKETGVCGAIVVQRRMPRANGGGRASAGLSERGGGQARAASPAPLSEGGAERARGQAREGAGEEGGG